MNILLDERNKEQRYVLCYSAKEVYEMLKDLSPQEREETRVTRVSRSPMQYGQTHMIVDSGEVFYKTHANVKRILEENHQSIKDREGMYDDTTTY